jgi:hypothetical protein
VHGGVEGNRGRKAGREAEAEAAAEKRKREKTENLPKSASQRVLGPKRWPTLYGEKDQLEQPPY